MKKTSIFGITNKRNINQNWFTGKVWMKELSKTIGSKEQDMYHVHFIHGARTKLHLHNGSQILIGVNGSGSVITYKKTITSKSGFKAKLLQTIKLSKGDIVYIKPGTLHTHGSVSDDEFSHIAINVLPNNLKYETEWFELDESEYRRI